MAAVNLVIQAAEAPGPDRGDIYFSFQRSEIYLSNSLRKTIGKSVTESRHVYITQ